MNAAIFLAVASFVGVSSASLCAQEGPKYRRTEDVIYGRKFGLALTLDVFEPSRKNGAAIFYVVSSGMRSGREFIQPEAYQTFLDRGYTVLAVMHGSQPLFPIVEIDQDIHRAIRFVRHNASRWAIDGNKFGVTGASSGGNLSLMIGTQGGPGKADAKDPADRESSAVQAVACFFPTTDYQNWRRPGDYYWDHVDLSIAIARLGPKGATRESQGELGKEISPISFVTAKMPPTLVYHGDADQLAPLYQSQSFAQKCKELGAPFKLIVKPGAGHGALFGDFARETNEFADWFDEHLLGAKTQ